MEINFCTKNDLITLMEKARKQYSNAKSDKQRLAISNYIGHLYQGFNFMGDEEFFCLNKEVDSYKCAVQFFANDNSLFRKWDENFIINKDFHNEYIDDCLDVCEDIYNQVLDLPKSYDSEQFSKNDYWDIFFEFTKSLGQSKEFERYIRNGNIFNMANGYTKSCLGLTSFNPISGESAIFLDCISYKLSDMITNVHEFGHCVDFGMIFEQGSINLFNKHYASIYDEVLSLLYEKLFLSFLNDKGVKTGVVRDKFCDMVDLQYDYLLSVLLFTFLDDKYLKSGNYKKLSNAVFSDITKEYFLVPEGIDSFIREANMDLFCDVSYAYGDIIASFLADDINKHGEFNSPLMRDFLNARIGFFDPDFIERNDLSPERYQKVYQKQLDMIKNN